MRVDPDGMADDWVESKETGNITWDDNATSADNTPDGFIYRGQTYARAKQYDNVNVKGTIVNGNALEVYKADKTLSITGTNEQGMVRLPVDNPGAKSGQFTSGDQVVYNYHMRNDVLFNGVPEQDQWGTPENIAAYINLAVAYNTEYPGETLSFGDISTETGASPRYKPDGTRHLTHTNGNCADLKYPTKEGATSNVSNANIERTNWLLNAAANSGFRNRIIGPKASYNMKGHTQRLRGHDNHIHIGK